MLTAWALVHAPSVPWSGLKGIGVVAQTSGVPAPLTLRGPAARATAAITMATATTARATNRGAGTAGPQLGADPTRSIPSMGTGGSSVIRRVTVGWAAPWMSR